MFSHENPTLTIPGYEAGVDLLPMCLAAATPPNRVAVPVEKPDGTDADLWMVNLDTGVRIASAEAVNPGLTIPGYEVAGKTGTARIPLPDRPGYYTGQYFASFIGFLPASDPHIVIAAILDRPVTEYGGVAAAPLFQQVARYAITRHGIEPGRSLRPPPSAEAQP